MNKDFSQVMSERTDKQLVEIVTIKRDEYQPEALIAAEKELSRRQIDPANFYSEEEKETLTTSSIIHKETEPLNKLQIIFVILSPIIFISGLNLFFYLLKFLKIFRILGLPIIIFLYYLIHKWLKDNGYERKARELMHWISYTLYIYIGLLIIAGIVVFFFTQSKNW